MTVRSASLILTSLFCMAGAAAEQAATPATQSRRADFNASSCTRPEWPRGALRREESGVVTMSFLVGADGAVRGSKVVKSSGFPELDEAALSATAKCRFTPALAEGRPVESSMTTQYVWTLE